MNLKTFIAIKHYACVTLRITLAQLSITLACCSLSLANPVSAQNLDSLYVTVGLHQQNLESVFKQIEDQTGLRFAYQIPEVGQYREVTLASEKRSVRATLDLVLANTTLKYRQADRSVIIYAQSATNTKAMAVTVSGIVRSKDNTPLPGVNIFVKGTNLGTTTDAEGRYQVEVEQGSILVFSFIGYKTQEVTVANQSVVDITLEEDATTLETVEISANYYTTTQRTSTGNVARATSKDISGQPVINPMLTLQGRLAGVEIKQLSGMPGTLNTVIIRGENSLRRGPANYPLYIIDGVPLTSAEFRSFGYVDAFDPLNTINPENIYSIEVLKDAAATAIYGSRGANGVIIITTKKAPKNQEGRTGIDVSFYKGVAQANRVEGLMNSKQYLTMRREAFKNDGITPTDNPLDNGTDGKMFAPDLTVWDTTRYTDWQKELIGGTANITDAQVSVYGGNGYTSFRFNTGYHSETTIFRGDFGYDRITGGLNLDHRSKDNKFSASVSFNYGVDDRELYNMDLTQLSLNLVPVAPKLYKEDGTLNWEIHQGRSTWQNPLANLEMVNRAKTNNLITNALLQYEILPGLIAKTSMGYTRATSDEVLTDPWSSVDPTVIRGENTTHVSNNSSSSWIIEPQLIYNTRIGKGQLDLLVGSSWQSRGSSLLSLMGYGYPSDELLGDLASAANIAKISNTGSEYRYCAFFGRVAFNWNEKYLIDLTGRRDGSSRFGFDQKFATFGAVGLGWVFSEEKWMKEKLSFLSFGKLRASYGASGSDAIGDYGYIDTYTATARSYGGESGLYPFGLSNPDYAWEIVKKLELGLELGFFQDRLSWMTSWYLNRASNQLVGDQLPQITGFGSVTANLPATVQNTGLEIVLNSTNMQAPQFRWSSSFNLTIPRNKLVSFPNLEGSTYYDDFIIGEPITIGRRFVSKGVNPQTGLYEVEDINGDGLFDLSDQVVNINVDRRFYGGLENRVSWKGIEVSFLLEFVRQLGASDRFILDHPPGYFVKGLGNQFASVLDRWQEVGDNASYQRFTQTTSATKPLFLAGNSNMGFRDASYIRLKTVSLGYNVSAKWTQKVRLKQCRVYASAQNLATFTKFRGGDPQTAGRPTLPPLKALTMGIQLSF